MFKKWLVLFFIVLGSSNLLVTKVHAEELEKNILEEQVDSQTVETEEIIDIIKDEVFLEEIIDNEQQVEFEKETDTETESDENKKLIDEENNTEITDNIEETKIKEDIFTSYSANMTFEKGIVTIKGNIKESITTKEILANIDIVGLQNEYLIDRIGIINEEDIWLNDDDYVTNLCYLVLVSNEFVSHYQVSFLGDLNQDSIVNEDDIETGIDNFFEEIVVDEPSINDETQEKEAIDNEAIAGTNDTTIDKTIIEVPVINEASKKEIITIQEEVSYIDAVIDNNSYEVETPIIEESLNINLENTEQIEKFVEDEIIVELEIDGLVNNYINTISGQIIYNKEILMLENIYILVVGKVIGNNKNDKFIYVLDNYKENGTLLIMIFKGIGYGTTKVSIEQLNLIMNGTMLSFESNVNLNITINEYGKGGDIEPPENVDTPELEQPKDSVINVETNNDNKPVQLSPTVNTYNPKEETVITLSNDNYIKNMEIIGYEILFDKDISNYSIEVAYDVEKLNLNVVLNNDKSTYLITGNEYFKVGQNEVILTVLAEDGSIRDYVINVNKKEDLSLLKIKSSDDKSLFEFIVLIILIATIVMLIYKLLKKDN